MGDGFSKRRYCVGLGVADGARDADQGHLPDLHGRAAGGRPGRGRLRARLGTTRRRRRDRTSAPPPSTSGSRRSSTSAIIAPWYITNLQPTLDYINSTTSGPLSEGAGPEHPCTFHAIASFTTGDDQRPTSRGFSASPSSPRSRSTSPRSPAVPARVRVEPLLRLAVRRSLGDDPVPDRLHRPQPGLPADGAGDAGDGGDRRRGGRGGPRLEARVAIAGLATVALVLPDGHPMSSGSTPRSCPTKAASGSATTRPSIQLDDRRSGTSACPNRASAIRSCASWRRRRRRKLGGRRRGGSACCSRKRSSTRNTFYYLTHLPWRPVRHGRPSWSGPTVRAGLAANLHECDFALYMNARPAPPDPDSRVAIVNDEFALRIYDPGPVPDLPRAAARSSGRRRPISPTVPLTSGC